MAAQGYQPPDGHSTWAGCNGQRAWLSTWALSNNVLMIGRGDAPKDLDHDQKGTSLHGKLFALVRAEGLIKPALEEAKEREGGSGLILLGGFLLFVRALSPSAKSSVRMMPVVAWPAKETQQIKAPTRGWCG